MGAILWLYNIFIIFFYIHMNVRIILIKVNLPMILMIILQMIHTSVECQCRVVLTDGFNKVTEGAVGEEGFR